MAQNNRIFYFDALKAFAILLVIIGHLPLYVYQKYGVEASLLGAAVATFHMHLFMMISGYFTNIHKIHLGKRAKYLIPFFVFGVLYAYLAGSDLIKFLTSEAKGGYWYLLVLFVFCCFACAIKKLRVNLYAGVALVWLLFLGVHLCFHRTVTGMTLCTDHLWQFWPAFGVGMLLREGALERINVHPLLAMGLFLSMAVVVDWCGLFFGGHTVILYMFNVAFGIAVALFFFILFGFASTKLGYRFWGGYIDKCKDVVNAIGTHTLEIYVLHYFLITFVPMQWLCGWMLGHHPALLEFIFSPILAVLTALICVVAAKWMYKCRLGFLFGK